MQAMMYGGEEARVMYVARGFKQQLVKTKADDVNQAFTQLSSEIEKLSEQDQLFFYTLATHFLQSVRHEKKAANLALEIFIINFQTYLESKKSSLKTLGLAIAVVGIALSLVMAGLTLGFGVGFLMGIWAAPMAFLTSLLAFETSALVLASSSIAVGMASGAYAAYSFFKESNLEKALKLSINEVKKHALRSQDIHTRAEIPAENEVNTLNDKKIQEKSSRKEFSESIDNKKENTLAGIFNKREEVKAKNDIAFREENAPESFQEDIEGDDEVFDGGINEGEERSSFEL